MQWVLFGVYLTTYYYILYALLGIAKGEWGRFGDVLREYCEVRMGSIRRCSQRISTQDSD